jgi:hypothetical protein
LFLPLVPEFSAGVSEKIILTICSHFRECFSKIIWQTKKKQEVTSLKKKMVIFAVITALLLTIAIPAMAATDNSALTWFKQKMEAKKTYVDQAVQNGQLTEEQGKVWKDHFDYMINFHEQNGFICPGGGTGKMGGPGFGPGRGMGSGRMMGPGWQVQDSQ